MSRETVARQSEAIKQLHRQKPEVDGEQVVQSLEAGLSLLRDLLYVRIHLDVEQNLGQDSMMIPLSEAKTEDRAKTEIEMFQIVEVAWATTKFAYLPSREWCLQWLGKQRIPDDLAVPENVRQLAKYNAQSPDVRRMTFMDRLMRILPESGKAPLVLFRLLPLAVHQVTAQAFGDDGLCRQVRTRQSALLPAIEDCPQCRGGCLENGDQCAMCGNPLWNYQWLTVAD